MDHYFGEDTFASIGAGGRVNYARQDDGVRPMFFTQPEQDFAATEKDGVPRFRDIELVRIVVAGDSSTMVCQPVDDAVKQRFPDQYRMWKQTRENRVVNGTPIKEWPLLTTLQVAEMTAAHIETVEELANLSDSNVTRIGEGRVWRAKAAAWLDSAKNGADSSRYAAENERMRADMETMKRTIAELSAKVDAQDDENGDEIVEQPTQPTQPKRLGRPPRQQAA
jgi:hypothetical protein